MQIVCCVLCKWPPERVVCGVSVNICQPKESSSEAHSPSSMRQTSKFLDTDQLWTCGLCCHWNCFIIILHADSWRKAVLCNLQENTGGFKEMLSSEINFQRSLKLWPKPWWQQWWDCCCMVSWITRGSLGHHGCCHRKLRMEVHSATSLETWTFWLFSHLLIRNQQFLSSPFYWYQWELGIFGSEVFKK